jgi:hypothetical protein
MAPPRKQNDEMVIRVRGELAQRFKEYMVSNGHGNSSEAIREIFSVYFASMPMAGAVKAARDNVANSTKHWMLTRLTNTLRELQYELDQQVAALEASGFGDRR